MKSNEKLKKYIPLVDFISSACGNAFEVVLDGDTGIFEIVELIMLSVILFIELSSVSVYGDLSFWGKRLNASNRLFICLFNSIIIEGS